MASRGGPAGEGNQYAPITAAKRKKILALHGDGMSRNDIARQVKVSGSTVTKIVHEAGLAFDRTATIAATEAGQADAAARRAKALLAELQILELTQAHVVSVLTQDGTHRKILRGAEGIERAEDLDFLPADDAQRLANSRSSSVTIINRLTDTTAGEQAARGLLGAIADSLGINDAPQESGV